MSIGSKKLPLIILAIASLIYSRLFFLFLNDPEGPNLLIVVGLALVLYFLSIIVYLYINKVIGINNISRTTQRKRLHHLEKEGKWVFHGSGVKLEKLEPRQAYNYPKNSDEEKIPDGEPAVFASPLADIAIFMSIFNKANAPMGARSGFSLNDDGSVEFRVNKETMDQIKSARGYVYVFDNSKFLPKNPGESVSYDVVVPGEVILVTEKDLPANILIKDF